MEICKECNKKCKNNSEYIVIMDDEFCDHICSDTFILCNECFEKMHNKEI